MMTDTVGPEVVVVGPDIPGRDVSFTSKGSHGKRMGSKESSADSEKALTFG
jgi:hypothetical protein